MATPEEQAIQFKNQGNKAFAVHDWQTAIDLYTKAIELNDKEPTFWANRAQVRTLWFALFHVPSHWRDAPPCITPPNLHHNALPWLRVRSRR